MRPAGQDQSQILHSNEKPGRVIPMFDSIKLCDDAQFDAVAMKQSCVMPSQCSTMHRKCGLRLQMNM